MGCIFRLAVLFLVLAILLKILNDLDINRVVYSHQPGPCQPLGDLDTGSEDIILHSSGLAIISNGLYLSAQSENCPPGGLYTYDLADPKPPADGSSSVPDPPILQRVKLVNYPDPSHFHPAGIAAWDNGNPRDIRLYAVNTYKYKFNIDVFILDLDKLTATYKKTIEDPTFNALNNLVMVGPDKFYATNTFKNTDFKFMVIESLLKLPLGSVVYYNGKEGAVVASGLKGPNGIALSNDKKRLYVAMCLGREITTYRVHPNASLELTSTLPLATGPDNLFIDSDEGALWTGGHPVSYKLNMHFIDVKKYSAPSQVLKIKYEPDGITSQSVTEVYGDDGDNLQAASSAVKYGNKLLIGTIKHKLMLCLLKHH